ncbi:hypothetical protein CLCY_5c01460 [Clostridium cylindrosporum DSM 605]|uniref:Uncharacterized protein n=1 Tax=Clostridium cylindrosporum DSM 605 TaxID=1121307 RepID=A0A0J8DAN3_CLOCY|nr:hypothetical protein CLCY_5c01460 [Clostridium cylindrosporum DSM 605]
MTRVKYRLLEIILAIFIIAMTLSSLLINDVNTVYAAESKALTNAKAKISHLTKSLKANYLGIKNQGMWQTYISQSRDLINKIPNSEKIQRDALAIEVNKDEALVKGLARVNQVEKSITPKDKGGYGNSLSIKNAETWNGYLHLAKIDLEKVDKSIFKKQYDELIGRLDNVSKVVKDIEDKFQVEYSRVVKLYEEAKESNDLNKAKEALKEAEKLGTCDRSDKLEEDIKEFINAGTSEVEPVPIPIKIKSGNLSTDYDIEQVLNDIDKLQLNTLNIPVVIEIDNLSSSNMSINKSSEEKAIKLIKKLIGKNINIILEPYPWIADGTLYETEWKPDNMNTFFLNWR